MVITVVKVFLEQRYIVYMLLTKQLQSQSPRQVLTSHVHLITFSLLLLATGCIVLTVAKNLKHLKCFIGSCDTNIA